MSNYIIHACPERMWYVDKYLVPSMIKQGIDNINIKCDDNHIGCLESCMQIFSSVDKDGDSWHLQDDVIICRDFKTHTQNCPADGIVCGFSSMIDPKRDESGQVDVANMWWSFPCIRIPNYLARECAEWFYSFARGYAKYWEWVHMGKCDDNFFREFLLKNHPDIDVMNLSPNLVDHVDYLIGGSMVNTYRGDVRIVSNNFADKDLVDELSKKLESK